MRLRHLWVLVSVSLGVLVPAMVPAEAQTAALSGQVSSADEGVMEGVLVSAKKDGSTITTTVVTNAQGRYSFPADRLAPAATPSRSAPSATGSMVPRARRCRRARRPRLI